MILVVDLTPLNCLKPHALTLEAVNDDVRMFPNELEFI